MNEHHIEQALKRGVEAAGGICWKLVSPGTAGVPDRICIMSGRIVFVELKAPGRQPRPIQHRRIQQLTDHGMSVLVVDSLAGVKEVLDALSAA
ncbi:VRR-NUC domain-containing protein [Trueperella pecoris]|uniref:VRR-NUC domain-containing protein n=1 Tax=Trueperella pecoris TaxID=2733571 RepID=A0A7M1R0F4_9ACTO|nr:VRR-NUC domain-containing protein [Trueperella pecoris]QOR46917.1 VRR-NUC domain-containing protein [Trueperella pecoris]